MQIRLGRLIEACDHELDAVATGDLSQKALIQMVWLLTRVKPCVSIACLRVSWYTELNTSFRRKHLALLRMTNSRVKDSVEEMRKQECLSDEWVDSLCQSLGWSDAWMQAPAAKGKAKARAKAGAPLPVGQNVLPFAPAANPPQSLQPSHTLRYAHEQEGAQELAQQPRLGMSTVAKASAPAPVLNNVGAGGVLGEPSQPVAGSNGVVGVVGVVGVASVQPPVDTMENATANPSVPPEFRSEVEVETPEENVHAADELEVADPVNPADSEGLDDGHVATATLETAQEKEKPKCMVCHELILSDAGAEEVLALECGHPFHKQCLLRTWSIGNWPYGWCPSRCLDHIILAGRPSSSNDDVIDMSAADNSVPLASSNTQAVPVDGGLAAENQVDGDDFAI